ncbi:hypothetical protein GOODEAATRI_025800, partial [Goodea atripinnis]
ISANNKNLTEERDELRKDLSNLASHLSSLTNERDELKKINFGIEASLKNLTEESENLIRTIKSKYDIQYIHRTNIHRGEYKFSG